MPKMATAGVRDDDCSSRRARLSPDTAVRRRMWAVTVVPMLAPIMMPMAWRSLRTPAPTRPTTRTVAAEEEWMTAVTAAPNSTARPTLPVSRSSMASRRPWAAFSRLPPITDIP